MGHLAGKDVYRELGRKIDGLSMRAPWSEKLRAVLRELYSEDDARLVAAMPWGFSRIGRLEKVTGIPRAQLEAQLASLCPRGLVMDVFAGGDYYYAPSPMIIGIFEFTMMRTGDALPVDRWAGLFRDYLEEGGIYRANFGDGQQVSLMRAVVNTGLLFPIFAGVNFPTLCCSGAQPVGFAAGSFRGRPGRRFGSTRGAGSRRARMRRCSGMRSACSRSR